MHASSRGRLRRKGRKRRKPRPRITSASATYPEEAEPFPVLSKNEMMGDHWMRPLPRSFENSRRLTKAVGDANLPEVRFRGEHRRTEHSLSSVLIGERSLVARKHQLVAVSGHHRSRSPNRSLLSRCQSPHVAPPAEASPPCALHSCSGVCGTRHTGEHWAHPVRRSERSNFIIRRGLR